MITKIEKLAVLKNDKRKLTAIIFIRRLLNMNGTSGN